MPGKSIVSGMELGGPIKPTQSEAGGNTNLRSSLNSAAKEKPLASERFASPQRSQLSPQKSGGIKPSNSKENIKSQVSGSKSPSK